MTRAVRVGAVLVTAAAAVLTSALPSQAATAITLSQAKGPYTGTNTITLTGGTFATGTSSGIEFNTATACPAAYALPSTTVKVVSTITVNGSDLDVVVPTLTAGQSYNVCVYDGTTAGSSVLTEETSGKPYAAVTASTAMTISPDKGANSGGDVITLTDNATAFGVGTAVEFATACPTTYGTPSATIFAGTNVVVTPGTSTLTVESPSGLTAQKYYVCAYTGSNTGSSTLITRTSTTAFNVTKLNVAPAAGPLGGTNTVVLSGANVTYAASTAVEFQTAASCTTTYATAAPATAVIAATSVTVDTTTLTVVVPELLAGTYNLCAYADDVVGSSALTAGTAAKPYTASVAGTFTLSPDRETGAAGGVAVTATDNTMEYNADTAVEFQTAATCSATYATPAAGSVIVATAPVSESDPNVLDIVSPSLQPGVYSVCAYTGNTVDTSPLMSAADAGYTVYGELTLSAYNGPGGGGAAITVTTTGAALLASTVVEFNSAAVCPTASGGGIATSGNRLLTSTKMAVTVPAGVVVVGGVPTPYQVCTYNSGVGLTAETLTPYTVATASTLTAVAPTSGAAQGGTTITVTGTNLLNVSDVTIDGVAVQNLTVLDASTFTGVTPAHVAGGPFAIVALTPSGTVKLLDAFTYTNGIAVEPSHGANTQVLDIDVMGVGFDSLTFNDTSGADPSSTDAHVYLVHGIYNPTTYSGSVKVNDGVLECVDVLVISDSELVCKMELTGAGYARPTSEATRMVADGVTNTDTSLVSATANFTQRDVGLTVTGAGVLASTTILSVTNSTTVVLSQATTATATGVTIYLSAPRVLADGVTTTGEMRLESATAHFLPKDVGLTVTGTGIPAGTVIASVIDDDTAVLSAAATATGTGVALTLLAPRTLLGVDADGSTNLSGDFRAGDVGKTITGTGVPGGTTIVSVVDETSAVVSASVTSGVDVVMEIGAEYKTAVPTGIYSVVVVSDGSPDADLDPAYFQTVISSGSTFTVSEY